MLGLQTTHGLFLIQHELLFIAVRGLLIVVAFLVVPSGSEGKASACNAGDPGSIPGLGRSPGEGNGNSLQYSCLETPMDGEAQWATVHGVAKRQTRLSDVTFSCRGAQGSRRVSLSGCSTWTQ